MIIMIKTQNLIKYILLLYNIFNL
jgi:ribosome biogenesis protein BRX1